MNFNSIPKINENIKIYDFDVSSEKEKYLLEVDDSARYEIDEIVYQIISLIDGKHTIDKLTEKYNDITENNITIDELIEVIDQHLIPKRIVYDSKNKLDHDYEIDRKNSYLSFQLQFINEENLRKIVNYFSILYQPFLAIPLLIISLLSHLDFYKILCFLQIRNLADCKIKIELFA